jgi:hypothetical protein
MLRAISCGMSDKIRDELEAIKPAVNYGPQGYRHLGMGAPLSYEQEQMHLAKFRSMTPSAEALRQIDLLGLREKLVEVMAAQRAHTEGERLRAKL